MKSLRILMMLPLLAFLCTGCLYVTGGSANGDSDSPAIKGFGLGPKAPVNVWTDGDDKVRTPFAIKTDTYVKLATQVNPAVVNIFTSQKLEAGIGFGPLAVPIPNEFKAYSLGTGFIISEDGFMLTNYHVIKQADEIFVFLHDQNEVQKIKVIGTDPLTDLALLKIESDKKLPYLPLADTDLLEIGTPVVAVGNPFGLGYSMTTGVISAKNRTLSPGTRRGNFEQYLQTSALINPGNSGGPLLNLYGEVVGINTAIIAQGQGIGFAIPANLIKELMPQLVRKGRIDRGYIGIAVVDLTAVMAEKFKVSEKEGVLIARIDSKGPAYLAGVRRGDVILSIDGKSAKDAHDVARRIATLPGGQDISLQVVRDGKRLSFNITTDAY